MRYAKRGAENTYVVRDVLSVIYTARSCDEDVDVSLWIHGGQDLCLVYEGGHWESIVARCNGHVQDS